MIFSRGAATLAMKVSSLASFKYFRRRSMPDEPILRIYS